MKRMASYGMAGALTLLLAGAARADLSCEIGVLTAATLEGLNPATGAPWKAGDKYRFAFQTSTSLRCPHNDITWYDNYLQGLANDSTVYPISADDGVTWKVIGSTDSVDARVHTRTNPFADGVGYSIYLLDGSTLVAKDNAELWSAQFDLSGDVMYSGGIQNPITLTEIGTIRLGWPYTGTMPDGTKRTGDSNVYRRPLGNLNGVNYAWGQGNSGEVTQWVFRGWTGRNNADNSIYALSDPLKIQAPTVTIIAVR